MAKGAECRSRQRGPQPVWTRRAWALVGLGIFGWCAVSGCSDERPSAPSPVDRVVDPRAKVLCLGTSLTAGYGVALELEPPSVIDEAMFAYVERHGFAASSA